MQNGNFDRWGGSQTAGDSDALDESVNDSRELTIEAGNTNRGDTNRSHPIIVVATGRDEGRRFELTGALVSLGRGMDNDIVLTDLAVSRHHLRIEKEGSAYRLQDLATGNGTLVNGREEDGPYKLQHGDRVEVGNTVLRFDNPNSTRLSDVLDSVSEPVPGDYRPLSERERNGATIPAPSGAAALSGSYAPNSHSSYQPQGGPQDFPFQTNAALTGATKAEVNLWPIATVLGMVAVGVTVWAIMRSGDKTAAEENNLQSADSVAVVTPEKVNLPPKKTTAVARLQTTTGKKSFADMPRDTWGHDERLPGEDTPPELPPETTRTNTGNIVTSTVEEAVDPSPVAIVNVDVEPGNPDAGDAIASAKKLYKKRDFSGAAEALADIDGNKEATSLQRSYAALHAQTRRGKTTRNDVTALAAYKKAKSIDRKLGGRHRNSLNDKIREVAPGAAQKHLANKDYQLARETAALASSRKAKPINDKLEALAKERLDRARKANSEGGATSKQKARVLLKQAKSIAPRSSKTYREAIKLLARLK